MFYSDDGLRHLLQEKDLVVDQLCVGSIRPGSIILHLAENFIFLKRNVGVVDVSKEETYPETELKTCGADGIVLAPGGFVLGSTKERVGLSKKITGHLSNISGLARLGLNVAGSTHVAPGFGSTASQQLTLEIFNCSNSPLLLRPGMRICHLIVGKLESISAVGYAELFPSKYQSRGPNPSEYFKAG